MESLFPIFKKDSLRDNQFYFLGNGFFIDKFGNFVTAGHVLNSKEDLYVGFLNDENYELYPIKKYKIKYKKIYGVREYTESIIRDKHIYQHGPEYKDIAIGHIEKSNTPYYVFTKKRPLDNEFLRSIYYGRNKNLPKMIELVNFKIPGKFIEQMESHYILPNRLKLAEIPFELFPYNKINFYNNCIVVNGNSIKGSSGSPVINQKNQIVGIIIGGDKIKGKTILLLSRYILKKVRKMIKEIN